MRLKLPATISSAQDLTALVSEIREYSRWFSHSAIQQQRHAKDTTEPPTLSPTAAELLREWSGMKSLSLAQLESLIAALEAFAHTAPSLTITLAAPASGDLKKTLVTWCRNNIEADILVAFQFNSTLLGGMVVRYKSHILDLSFRRQILAARANFPEVLRRV